GAKAYVLPARRCERDGNGSRLDEIELVRGGSLGNDDLALLVIDTIEVAEEGFAVRVVRKHIADAFPKGFARLELALLVGPNELVLAPLEAAVEVGKHADLGVQSLIDAFAFQEIDGHRRKAGENDLKALFVGVLRKLGEARGGRGVHAVHQAE